VRDAGLATVVLEGAGVAEAARRLRGMPGVDQVAAYGTTLHVIGRDRAALMRSATEVAGLTGTQLSEAASSLEDVFIQLMGEAQDNAA
jgi:ABC-2 type transport system ATP-binding protein